MANAPTPGTAAAVEKTVAADASKVGAAVDAAVKPKINVRIWVVIAVGIVANVIGVLFHI